VAGRVTQNMMNAQLLRNLNYNLSQMNRLQNQVATGRKINKPSDDPVGITYSLRYRSELAANEQYQKNVDHAISWLEFTDSMLNQANNVLQRVRELAVEGANGTNDQTALDAIRSEIEQLREQMVTIGNSQFNGKYIFNGQYTDVKPYSEGLTVDPATGETVSEAAKSVTDMSKIQYEVGVGVKISVNISGNEVFGGPNDEDNVFRILDELVIALKNGKYEDVGAALGKLDSRMDSFLAKRSDIGAMMNRIELSQDRLEDIGINLQTLQSKTEDADVAELITNLKTYENVYQSSLAVGARLITPSLVDFLR